LAGERFGRLAGGLPKKFGEGASGAPAIYTHYAISVIGIYCFQVVILVSYQKSRANIA